MPRFYGPSRSGHRAAVVNAKVRQEETVSCVSPVHTDRAVGVRLEASLVLHSRVRRGHARF
jgi:hypothetical protein